MAFIESPRFPETALLGATFAPKWSTFVEVYGSGQEQRNQNWLYPLTTANLPFTDEQATIEQIRDWFMAARGRANGFRVKDFSDYKSCPLGAVIEESDQVIGTGDGSTVDFQLIKTYTIGAESSVRKISKPVSGTVEVALDGTPTGLFTVDTTTGVVTMDSAPGGGVVLTACFEFDVPMRFDLDELPIGFVTPTVLQISSIPLMELRL